MSFLRKVALAIMVVSMGLFTLDAYAGVHSDASRSVRVESDTIVQIAVSDPDFSTLVTALKTADLVNVLSSEGPFTVFAPNNEAFSKLPPGELDKLMKPENRDQLVAILKYHVVPGKLMSGDLKTMKVKALNGEELSIVVDGGKVTVNGVEVIQPDMEASNGVIHEIDGVLLPQS